MEMVFGSENQDTRQISQSGQKEPYLTPETPVDLQNAFENSEYSEDYDEEEDSYYDRDLDLLPDVDIKHLSDGAYVANYAEKIIINAKTDETHLISTAGFLTTQDEITEETRKNGIKWIMQVTQHFSMSHESFFFAIHIFDIVLCTKKIPFDSLRYYLAACIWLARKMDKRSGRSIKIFEKEEEIQATVQAETDIVLLLDFHFDMPTVKLFLMRLLVVLDSDQLLMEASNFFCEASTLLVELLDFQPSVIASAACLLAQLSIGREANVSKIMLFAHLNDIQELKLCTTMLLIKSISFVEDNEDVLCERYRSEGMKLKLEELKLSMDILTHI